MEGGELDVVPGHFMLPLPINQVVNIDKSVVTSKLTELQHDLKARLRRPEELAIGNLQGVLSFRIREYEGALGYFQEVLSKDPYNLNALANLQYAMEKLFRMADAKVYEDKHKTLIQVDDDTPSVGSRGHTTATSTVRRRRLKARCLAEHAYAYACDIHIDRVGEIRYKEANGLYQDAFQLAGDLIHPSEADNWKVCMAKNAHKMVNFLVYKAEYAGAVEQFREAEKLFCQVTQSKPGDPDFQWESWRNLADMIRGTRIRKQFKRYEFRPELNEYTKNPEKCMLKAMEIAPRNPKLLARYANFVYSLKQKGCNKKALDILDKSLQLDSSGNNFYAYSTRARINLKTYKYLSVESEKNPSKDAPGPKRLEDAKQDYEKALRMRVCPWDLSYLGEVYHLLAKHRSINEHGSQVVRPLLEKALLYFTKAADCEDGESRREIHLMRGRCLNDMGEYLPAISCFKQAILCEPVRTSFSGNFTELLQVYLHLLQQDATPTEPLMAEIAYNLKEAQAKYGRSILQEHTLSKLKTKYDAEILKLAEYCGRFPGRSELVSLLSPAAVASEPPFCRPLPTGGVLEKEWRAHSQPQSGIQQRQGPPAFQSPVPSGLKKADPLLRDQAVSSQAGTRPTAAVGPLETGLDEGNAATTTQDAASVSSQFADDIIAESMKYVDQIKKAPESARVAKFEYDFYVVYPGSKRDWVFYTLLSELESVRRLKGYARHRDEFPGKYKLTEMIDQMKNSASILLVIGDDFSECEMAMHQALERKPGETRRLVVPILLSSTAVMPDELACLGEFEAFGEVKWEKLAKCIEQQMKTVSF